MTNLIKKRSGFALVLSLVLMAFLLLLMVSLSTLIHVETQSMRIHLEREEARQNAMLGLFDAIGQLQELTGQDTRVTARADILNTTHDDNRFWSGVWNSENQAFLGWLVSGESGANQAIANPDDTALMASLGGSYEIRAPKVNIQGDAPGRYAYWISDENTKAYVRNPRALNNADFAPVSGGLTGSMPGVEFIVGQGALDNYELPFSGGNPRVADSLLFEQFNRLTSLNDIQVLDGVQDGVGPNYFNDLTTHAYGLLTSTHPAFPGLKHDLSLQPDTSTLGNMSLGEGFLAYSQFQDYMVPLDDVDFITQADYRRMYRPQAPVPAVSSLLQGGNYPSDSSAKGTVVFSAHPVMTMFSFGFFAYVLGNEVAGDTQDRAVNRYVAPQDRDLGLQVIPLAKFWNPYTSGIDMRNRAIQVELHGFPDVTIEYHDLATEQVTTTTFKADDVFGNPMVFEYELNNHRRAAPGNTPTSAHITHRTAYDEQYWGPGRSIPFVRYRYDRPRRIFTHSANHTIHSFNHTWQFGAEWITARLDGKAPPMTATDPAPPITMGTTGNPSQIQRDISENLRIRYNIPAFTMNLKVYLVEVTGRDGSAHDRASTTGQRTLIQEIDADFPASSSDLRSYPLIRTDGVAAAHTLGRGGGGLYFVSPPETFVGYSITLRENAQGTGMFPAGGDWLQAEDVRAIYAREGGGSRDNYFQSFQDMDIWEANFEHLSGWSPARSDNDRPGIYSSMLTRMGRDSVQSIAGLSHYINTSRDVYLFELPRRPHLSLGALQHLQVHGFQPYAIGNSWGTENSSPTNASFAENVNLVFDRYFFSGIIPGVSEPQFGNADLTEALPHPALSFRNPNSTFFNEQALDDRNGLILDAGANSGLFLEVEGAFNVNSTSVEAWKAVLSSNRLEELVYSRGDTNLWDDNFIASDDTVVMNPRTAAFTRFPMSLGEIDATVLPTGNIYTNNMEDYKFSLIELTDVNAEGTQNVNRLDDLAQAIVALIRNNPRGRPFLTMAEFLGPYDPSNPDEGSLLERAITNAGINGAGVHPRSPGYLTQADILSALAPVLTVRGDTFRIRAYGEGTNPLTGNVKSKAWCEAVVQRRMQPVGWQVGDDFSEWLSPSNSFGREFEIIAFRWLNESEVEQP